MTFEAAPATAAALDLELSTCESVTVCDLTGAERFLVWSLRWCASRHDDTEFADHCLRDSFQRAGLEGCLPAFRRFAVLVQGQPAHCPPAARLGCWRINRVEALSLHAIACLQTDRFGEAWRALAEICTRLAAARAMLALGEIADALSGLRAQIRPWDAQR